MNLKNIKIETADPQKDDYVFYENTLLVGTLPENATVTVRGGSLIVAGQHKRAVTISTKHVGGFVQRSLAKRSNNEHHFCTQPKLTLQLGSLGLTINPLDIVFLNDPTNFSEEDKKFGLQDDSTPAATISSAGKILYLKDTPNNIKAFAEKTFCCLSALGSVCMVEGVKGVYIKRGGNFSSIASSRVIGIEQPGDCIGYSCAKNIYLGPTENGVINWGGSVATIGGSVEVFGQLTHTAGIRANFK